MKILRLVFTGITLMMFCWGFGYGIGLAAESAWTFSDDGVDFNIPGVSPEAVLLGDGSVRLYVTDMGLLVYRASDGLTFAQESGSLPQGSDPTLIGLADGTVRMYYVDMSDGTSEIWTARSSDGLTWSRETGTGIRNESGQRAWGVPDSVMLPDGRVRLYWVDMPENADPDALEVIKSAVSTNGLTFNEEGGYRTEGGYVDSYILVAEEGNWIGLFATTPARLPQEIYVGTSEDGLNWEIESVPIITVPGGNALDPTAVPLGDGTYRIYYSSTAGSDPFSGFMIKSGILGRKSEE